MNFNAHSIAIFDCDDTLIEGDSFLPFLIAVRGSLKVYGTILKALYHYGCLSKPRPELRTYLKQTLVANLLTGIRERDLDKAIDHVNDWRRWKNGVRQRLLDHCAAGHHVVIASGGLDIYLKNLLHDLPYHALICTEIGVSDGVLTGTMPKGNCVRERKAERVKDYINTHGPFVESWGYGNLPHDLPMLNCVKHRIVI